MQEIAPHVFIETGYAGVTLGAISRPHGLVLIDSPFRVEDVRSWRAALLNLGGGVDRILINLDAHFDRTLGLRAMECTVVGHEKTVRVIRSRPVTFKSQAVETGAEWELYNNIGGIRWLPPEMTFTERLNVYWDGTPVNVESRPGPATGASWAVLHDEKVIFVGDAVVLRQPPFLGYADLPAWIKALEELLAPELREYTLVSGRGGAAPVEEARHQIQFLQTAQALISEQAERSAAVEEVAGLASKLLTFFKPPVEVKDLYRQRLAFGLRQYYLRRHTLLAPVDQDE